MESKLCSRTEELTKQIAKLEIEYTVVKEEVRVLENEEKLRLHKKSMMEVKVDKLNASLKSYGNKAETIRHQLKKEMARHSRLSLGEQYYEKFLGNLPKDYVLQTHDSISDKEKEMCGSLKKQIEEVEREIEMYQGIIREKNVSLLSLSDQMGVSS